MAGAIKVFVSYSSRDESLRKELDTHLALLKRESLIETWTFRQIEAGDDWRSEIDMRLEDADVILLLVSAAFIASDYCWNVEVRRAVERHRQGTATVVPIVLRDCDWSSAPFAAIQALPAAAKPVANWRPRDKAWLNIVEALRRIAIGPGDDRGKSVKQTSLSSETVAQRVQRLAADSASRRLREEKLLRDGQSALWREYETLFRRLDELVREIEHATPQIGIASGWLRDYSIVRLAPISGASGTLTLHCYVNAHNSDVEQCGVVIRLLLGGMVLPQERNVAYPFEATEHATREYGFHLSSTNQWLWHDPVTNTFVSTDALAESLMNALLQLCDDVETGKVTRPRLW